MAKTVYVKSVLTGGGSDALDGIPYNSIQDGEFCFTLYKNQRFFVHYFDSSSSASESVPDVIAPDDVGSNYGRWLLAASRTKICDEDRDTCFETERSADEDIVRAKAGGQDIFEGYSSGIFSLVKQSHVSVKRTTSQTIATDTWTKIQLDTVDYDEQNEFDTTNYRFTATKGGIYIVSLRVRWDTFTSGAVYHRITKNGSGVAASLVTFQYDSNVQRRLPGCTVSIKLNAGDYIEGQVLQTSGGNLNLLEAYITIVKVA